MNKVCVYCQQEYIAVETHGIGRRQKYCSARCRLRDWQKHNPEKCSAYNKKHRLATTIVICRHCNQPIPNEKRKMGKIYCSNECLRVAYLKAQRKFREKVHSAYRKFKEGMGCTSCGYNKSGGSLDFHHIEDKDFRIDARRWWHNSPIVQAEMRRCVLLCKNCHYELHHSQMGVH